MNPELFKHMTERSDAQNLYPSHDHPFRCDAMIPGGRTGTRGGSGASDPGRGRPARRGESRRLRSGGAQGPRRVWRRARGSDHPLDEPMNINRVRSILGVWAPMAIGLFIIVTSVNFYFTANLTNGLFLGNLDSWRLVCSAGAFFL